MKWGSSIVNIDLNTETLYFIRFHQYLPSQLHLKILFDHCNCQNKTSHSQNRSFKKLTQIQHKSSHIASSPSRAFSYFFGQIFRSAVTSCTTSNWPVRPQEKSGSLIYDSLSDVPESRVCFASKNLTPSKLSPQQAGKKNRVRQWNFWKNRNSLVFGLQLDNEERYRDGSNG